MGSEKYPFKVCSWSHAATPSQEGHRKAVGEVILHDKNRILDRYKWLKLCSSHEFLFPSVQGVLDLLANRCLSQGTNAWTDVDHTCYTMTTAGSEGFLNLMPIYLDHILYPTLTVWTSLSDSDTVLNLILCMEKNNFNVEKRVFYW